jgi:hypothetical protein
MIRQSRAMRAAAAAMGGGGDSDYEEPSYSERLRSRKGEVSNKPSKSYLDPWMIDPSQGGEVTPAYGKDQVAVLPINLGYSIIETDSENAS